MVLDRVVGGASSRFEPTRSWQRSLAKTLTWRLFATADTFVISALVTGNLRWAGSIVGVEVVTKMMWYFLHERAWAYTRAGVATATRPCLGRLRQREHPLASSELNTFQDGVVRASAWALTSTQAQSSEKWWR